MPTTYAQTFSPKSPLEVMNLGMNFQRIRTMDTIASAMVVITVESGADPDPAAMMVGVPIVNGAEVVQRVTGGLDGCVYCLSFQATTATGQVFQETGYLPVQIKS